MSNIHPSNHNVEGQFDASIAYSAKPNERYPYHSRRDSLQPNRQHMYLAQQHYAHDPRVPRIVTAFPTVGFGAQEPVLAHHVPRRFVPTFASDASSPATHAYRDIYTPHSQQLFLSPETWTPSPSYTNFNYPPYGYHNTGHHSIQELSFHPQDDGLMEISREMESMAIQQGRRYVSKIYADMHGDDNPFVFHGHHREPESSHLHKPAPQDNISTKSASLFGTGRPSEKNLEFSHPPPIFQKSRSVPVTYGNTINATSSLLPRDIECKFPLPNTNAPKRSFTADVVETQPTKRQTITRLNKVFPREFLNLPKSEQAILLQQAVDPYAKKKRPGTQGPKTRTTNGLPPDFLDLPKSEQAVALRNAINPYEKRKRLDTVNHSEALRKTLEQKKTEITSHENDEKDHGIQGTE